MTDLDAVVNRSRFTGAQAQQTIRTVLDSARDVFRDRGYARTSMSDIASAAGISRANVYTYFRSKRDILIALGIANNDVFQRVIDEFPAARGSRAELIAWVGRYLDFLDVDQSFTQVWHEAARDDAVLRAESSREYARAWRTVGEALGSDELRGMVLVGAFERTWFFWRHLNSTLPREQIVDELVRLVT